MLPPQCVAGGRSSSPWASRNVVGVTGGLATSAAAAPSKSIEATKACWADGDGSARGGIGEA